MHPDQRSPLPRTTTPKSSPTPHPPQARLEPSTTRRRAFRWRRTAHGHPVSTDDVLAHFAARAARDSRAVSVRFESTPRRCQRAQARQPRLLESRKLSTVDGSVTRSSPFCFLWDPAARAVARRAPCFRSARSVGGDASRSLGSRAGRRSSRCVGTCVPTSTETPIDRGSVTRCDGQGVNRGNGSGSRASPGGRTGAALPRVRGPLDRADR